MKIGAFLRQNGRWLGAGALLTFLSSFGQTYFISIFADEIRGAYGLSHGAWGGIYTLGTSVSAAVMIWAGGLTDRFRVRVLGAVVLIGLIGACLMMASVRALWLLPVTIFALRFLGQGMCSHIAVVAMSRWFVATRGRALSVAGLGFAAGEAVLPILFVSLLLVIDWHLLWIAAAVVAGLSIPLLLWLLQTERTPQSVAETDQFAGMNNIHWTRNAAFRHWLFWFMVPALLGPSAFNTAFFFQQVHYAEVKGWAHIELVALFPLYTGFGICAMLLAGWLLDRFSAARLIVFYQLPLIVAFLIFAGAVSAWGALAGLLFLGMSQGANAVWPNGFWAEFYGTRHLGSIKAMATAVMVFGSAIGPGLTGFLIDAGVGIETQYNLVAGYFAIASVIMFIGVRRARVLLAR